MRQSNLGHRRLVQSINIGTPISQAVKMLKFLWNAFIAKLRILNMVKCECGCRDDHWVVRDRIEGIICEASIVCDNCGKETNYWAYRNTQYPQTYTGLISEMLHKLNPVQKYKNWKFERGLKRNHWRV